MFDVITGHEGHEEDTQLSANKQFLNDNYDSEQYDQHFAQYLLRFLLKSLHTCLVCIGFILLSSYLVALLYIVICLIIILYYQCQLLIVSQN